jgi:hypothetical protein
MGIEFSKEYQKNQFEKIEGQKSKAPNGLAPLFLIASVLLMILIYYAIELV